MKSNKKISREKNKLARINLISPLPDIRDQDNPIKKSMTNHEA